MHYLFHPVCPASVSSSSCRHDPPGRLLWHPVPLSTSLGPVLSCCCGTKSLPHAPSWLLQAWFFCPCRRLEGCAPMASDTRVLLNRYFQDFSNQDGWGLHDAQRDIKCARIIVPLRVHHNFGKVFRCPPRHATFETFHTTAVKRLIECRRALREYASCTCMYWSRTELRENQWCAPSTSSKDVQETMDSFLHTYPIKSSIVAQVCLWLSLYVPWMPSGCSRRPSFYVGVRPLWCVTRAFPTPGPVFVQICK